MTEATALTYITLITAIGALIAAAAPLMLKWINRARDRAAAAVPVVTASMALAEGLRAELDRQKGILGKVEEELTTAEKRIDRLEDRNDQLMQDFSRLTTDLAEVTVQNRNLVETVNRLSIENADLKKQVQELTTQLENAIARLEKLTAENLTLRDDSAGGKADSQ